MTGRGRRGRLAGWTHWHIASRVNGLRRTPRPWRCANDFRQQPGSWAAAGARRCHLCGSLAGATFRVDSDVDLLVEGVPADRWRACWEALENGLQRRVDLVRWEDASPSLLCIVDAWGEDITPLLTSEVRDGTR